MDKFVHRVYSYNPDCDLYPVSQGDVFDLASAFVNGIMPDSIVAPDIEYDGCDEPKSIIGKPANEFEAIHLIESLRGVSSSSGSSEEASESNG